MTNTPTLPETTRCLFFPILRINLLCSVRNEGPLLSGNHTYLQPHSPNLENKLLQ